MARKISLKGVWAQKKKLFGIGWSDIGQRQACQMEGRHTKAQALPLSGIARSKARYSGRLQEMGAKLEHVEEIVEMAKRKSRAPSQ